MIVAGYFHVTFLFIYLLIYLFVYLFIYYYYYFFLITNKTILLYAVVICVK